MVCHLAVQPRKEKWCSLFTSTVKMRSVQTQISFQPTGIMGEKFSLQFSGNEESAVSPGSQQKNSSAESLLWREQNGLCTSWVPSVSRSRIWTALPPEQIYTAETNFSPLLICRSFQDVFSVKRNKTVSVNIFFQAGIKPPSCQERDFTEEMPENCHQPQKWVAVKIMVKILRWQE